MSTFGNISFQNTTIGNFTYGDRQQTDVIRMRFGAFKELVLAITGDRARPIRTRYNTLELEAYDETYWGTDLKDILAAHYPEREVISVSMDYNGSDVVITFGNRRWI